MPQIVIAHEAHINAKHTIVEWCNFLREIAEELLILHPSTIGGVYEDGTSKVVEIDESKFFHRKYHRGQWRPGHWVFGAIERGLGKCFLVEVPDRTKIPLHRIIKIYILSGTIIVTDGWRAYRGIDQISDGMFEHRVVHERNFVDPNNSDVHTLTIENL